jgi:DNA repair protein RadC
MILLHNHPSGNAEPSSEDIAITKQLVEVSKVMGIPIHDHIIVAGNRFTSFAERGLMP